MFRRSKRGRPLRFRIGDRDHIIEEIVEQWYGPDDSFYRVRTDDGKRHLAASKL
jgi:hypothetical protein